MRKASRPAALRPCATSSRTWRSARAARSAAHSAVRAAVAEAVRLAGNLPLFAGGRSFGGRMTSQAQADLPLPGVRGLAFLGFPLHPAGKPGIERAEHLARVQGSRLHTLSGSAVSPRPSSRRTASSAGPPRPSSSKGYRFDLGGHRFFTELKPIERLWEEMLGDDFPTRPRLSRIYYDGRTSLSARGAERPPRQLGLVESVRCAPLLLRGLPCGRSRPAETFEDWVVGRFGRRLTTRSSARTRRRYGVFPARGPAPNGRRSASRTSPFCTPTLDLARTGAQDDATTLIEEFRYPRLGPGQMWAAFRARVESSGVDVRLNPALPLDLARRSRVDRPRRRRRTAVRPSTPSTPSSRHRRSANSIAEPRPARRRRGRAAAAEALYRDLCLVALIPTSRSRSPTTGSTSTIRAHGRGACRTSAPGARAWSSRARRVSASSISVSRATRSGRCRTRKLSLWRRKSSRASA